MDKIGCPVGPDKDHAGDPMSFVPIFHNESTWINNLPITQKTSPEDEDESSKQRDDEHHASNQSTTILDEHKNLRSNFIR
jgi:hypothetical protein